MADRLAYQALHRGEGLGDLGGPAPLARGRGIGDGLQPATPAAAMMSRTRSRKPPSLPAARAVMPASVPGDSGMPDISASACVVRCLDRNCPVYRYTMIAAIRGPYR